MKAVAVLANPARAVELLAGFAALRARGTDVPLDLPEESVEPLPVPEADPQTPVQPMDALGRMDAFARRVGFAPTRLPAWLQVRPTGHADAGPGFSFDWAELLPPLTLYLHLSVEDLARRGGWGGAVGGRGAGHPPVRARAPAAAAPVRDHPGRGPGAPGAGRRLRGAGPTTPGRASADAGRHLPVLLAPLPPAWTWTTPSLPASARTRDAGEPGRAGVGTRAGNLAPLGRHAHRIKTHGRWTVRQPFEGIYLWRDPHGQLYLVDHTGTHPVGRPDTPRPDPRLRPRHRAGRDRHPRPGRLRRRRVRATPRLGRCRSIPSCRTSTSTRSGFTRRAPWCGAALERYLDTLLRSTARSPLVAVLGTEPRAGFEVTERLTGRTTDADRPAPVLEVPARVRAHRRTGRQHAAAGADLRGVSRVSADASTGPWSSARGRTFSRPTACCGRSARLSLQGERGQREPHVRRDVRLVRHRPSLLGPGRPDEVRGHPAPERRGARVLLLERDLPPPRVQPHRGERSDRPTPSAARPGPRRTHPSPAARCARRARTRSRPGRTATARGSRTAPGRRRTSAAAPP